MEARKTLTKLMKNWNRTGKIKTGILAILFIPNLIFASPVVPQLGLFLVLMPLLFGSFALPLIVKVNSSFFGYKIEKPSWNANPLRLNRPLVFFQFGAWFMIVSGTSMILGSGIVYQVFHTFGLATVMFGIGMLIGITLTLKWFQNE